MIINDNPVKGNTPNISGFFDKVLTGLTLVLMITAGMGAWKLFNITESRLPIVMEHTQLAGPAENLLPNTVETSSISTTTGAFVASKNGKSYYLPSCAASLRILEKNRVWFNTREEAEKAGYLPAKNCKGL
ncbi:MAG: hypothetical protein M3Q73_01410 [bacterium]|nr:hypothetical protein [bacterium]